ncbi:MAG TPA: lactonase family protein [Candidatus Hydrogenedentes bacterium]|nr:lactonase family protein [Candidatus Hydrogenedentota bacterium]
MFTTKKLVAAVAVMSALGVSPSANAQDLRVYIGTYTRGDSDGIYMLTMNHETGALSEPVLAATTENPSFLAKHPTKPVVYAVGEMVETPGSVGGTISAYSIDAATGALTLINRQSTVGNGPCHVAVAPSGKHAAVANYGGGSVALLPILEDGSLAESSAFIQHEGKSVNESRQEKPHAHSVEFDNNGAYLFSADLGIDKVMTYRYDGTGTLIANSTHGILEPGSGPRHAKFHPTGRFFYVVNELLSTVTAFAYDEKTGSLDAIQTISTLPEGYTEPTTTAEIRVHPSGKFLYASNRGHDSIASFSIDQETGKLAATGHTPTGGSTPRNFNLDPSGKFLLAANQNSDSIFVFRINAETGVPQATGNSAKVATPVCVLFP